MTDAARPEDAPSRGRAAKGRKAASRGPGRRPGPSDTRETILAAARALFAEKGYDGASLRAIARAADVDPALVHHYFGNKEGVFVEAMRFPADPAVVFPRITAFPKERLGEAMVRVFLEIWGDDERREPLIAMLRSAMTNERAATLLREFVTKALFGRARDFTEAPLLNIEAAAGQMIGIMVFRYVLRAEPMASASEDELVELVAPTLQRYLVP
ncbi:MAG TPA: TetR family transcriptional regulator [Vulgatibacteraceae bacterium]|nr:TetR family transcriptional regulator [Vulgatibacteraceae bacterium]